MSTGRFASWVGSLHPELSRRGASGIRRSPPLFDWRERPAMLLEVAARLVEAGRGAGRAVAGLRARIEAAAPLPRDRWRKGCQSGSRSHRRARHSKRPASSLVWSCLASGLRGRVKSGMLRNSADGARREAATACGGAARVFLHGDLGPRRTKP
jgi:hypothetical protein